MVYKLNVTDHADELLDNLVYHLIYRLKNKEAAKHLLDSVESIYDRLVENPYQFPKSRDIYLAKKGYYEAVIPQMNYIVIFDVRKDIVNIVGYTFGRELDRESLYYERFITHLKHFLARVVKNETYGEDANDRLAIIVKDEFPKSYRCALRIRDYLKVSKKYNVSLEEISYLTIHIQRLSGEGQKNIHKES